MELTKIINPRFFPIKFFKEKLLILIDPMHCQINFNDTNLKQYFEILIEFQETEDDARKKTIIEKIETENIIEWIKKFNFNLDSDIEKDFNQHNCKFKLINKTLLSKYYQGLRNEVKPTLNNNIDLNLIKKSKKIKDEMKDFVQEIKKEYNKTCKMADEIMLSWEKK